MSITEIPLSILESLKPMDLEEYLYNLKVYEKDGMAHTNEERGIKRKLSSLRSFYKYLYKNEFIQSNPASKVSTPKIHEKNIIRLDADEVANLLDEVESGENLTKKQQMFHDRTKVRDLALLTLMLGTGIRVSECVGLDLDDVRFKKQQESRSTESGSRSCCILRRGSQKCPVRIYGRTKTDHSGFRG